MEGFYTECGGGGEGGTYYVGGGLGFIWDRVCCWGGVVVGVLLSLLLISTCSFCGGIGSL